MSGASLLPPRFLLGFEAADRNMLRWLVISASLITIISFSGRISSHLYFAGYEPLKAFTTASLLVQAVVVTVLTLLGYQLFGMQIRYGITYACWNERAAQDREKETRDATAALPAVKQQLEELNRSVLGMKQVIESAQPCPTKGSSS